MYRVPCIDVPRIDMPVYRQAHISGAMYRQAHLSAGYALTAWLLAFGYIRGLPSFVGLVVFPCGRKGRAGANREMRGF